MCYPLSYVAENAGQSPTDEEKTGGSKNVVLQKDTENSMDGVSKQQANGNRKNTFRIRKSQLKFFWIHNEERWLEKLNPHGEY